MQLDALDLHLKGKVGPLPREDRRLHLGLCVLAQRAQRPERGPQRRQRWRPLCVRRQQVFDVGVQSNIEAALSCKQRRVRSESWAK